MATDIKAMQLLFQRPLEPIFTSRDNGKAVLKVPDSFYIEGFNGAKMELQSRFGDDTDDNIEKIELSDIPKPNLEFTKAIRKKQVFNLFSDKHKLIAKKLIEMFLEPKDRSVFVSLAAYIKDRINPMLFQYAYTSAIQHRHDTAMVPIPPVAEQFPGNFIEPSVFKEARAEGSLKQTNDRITIDMTKNFTASDREDEQRLAYFREDIAINMHHWHWHLVYPAEGPEAVVRKDRRGELFYYMHHQILARYNVERFCNGLEQAKALRDLHESISEGYFPKIICSLNNRTYPPRISKQFLSNIERDGNIIDIKELDRCVDRIHDAIDKGYAIDSNDTKIPLDEVKGIDILGDIIEASALSPNRRFYGSLHNMGHYLIALAHDPDSRHLEDIGVMGDVTTAMRDPIFYRWHMYIDEIFAKFKSHLRTYNVFELSFNGVIVDSVNVKIISKRQWQTNSLATFWKHSDIDIGAGLDFGPNGAIYAKYSHLQYAPFDYNITVTNQGTRQREGTCRIFLCPKTNERVAPLSLEAIRNLAIEMDKFTVVLKPGENTIRRGSNQSSVTIPFERSFRRLDTPPQDGDDLAQFRFCGCGWPDHMLLPKGTDKGLEFDLYVMISDYNGDGVEEYNDSPSVCDDAESFCGLKDKLYPDKRAMGFPLDRPIGNYGSIEEFSSQYTNMGVTTIKIFHTNQHSN